MKTYKTWEVVKMVEENPDREFESEGILGTISCKSNGKFVEFKRGIDNIYRVSMDREWVEIREPMKFQEVLELVQNQEFSYNVEFRLTCDFSVYEGSLDEILINLSESITVYNIAKVLLNGEWFII